ncbi:hypothetical protein DPMN_127475 [Dreissena polymorpha]|uniref:Uncharacterized protein n=1 Tax=Dreissena polymorpha TaxID=45954 RepID=A0A9D4GZ10_DREPO|nr:hypothetical protein DPMN_127475 [Dreissena polymorpha]
MHFRGDSAGRGGLRFHADMRPLCNQWRHLGAALGVPYGRKKYPYVAYTLKKNRQCKYNNAKYQGVATRNVQ